MSNDANLPVFTLSAGPWRAEVFDPLRPAERNEWSVARGGR